MSSYDDDFLNAANPEGTANASLPALAFALIIREGNTRKDRLEAGRSWMRLNFKTTSLGMALRPVSQALQEYDEVASFYERVHEVFAGTGETFQILGLLGYGELQPRTPRWPIETRMENVKRAVQSFHARSLTGRPANLTKL